MSENRHQESGPHHDHANGESQRTVRRDADDHSSQHQNSPDPPNWVEKGTLIVLAFTLFAACIAGYEAGRLADLTQTVINDERTRSSQQATDTQNALTKTDNLIKATTDLATQAKRQADVAQKTLVTGQRAWLGIAGVAVNVGSENRIVVRITNSGKTPALNVHGCMITTNIGKNEPFVPPACPYDPKGSMGILPPGASHTWPFNQVIAQGKQIKLIRADEAITYFTGWIRYEDIFRRSHKLMFCIYQNMELSGFSSCRKYNGSD
ncbi:MAG: hypothetical protein ACYC9J_10885 [Sulfuricaulis sp.]